MSCEDFNDITTKGSVVVTEKHGAFLKVTDQHWVTVNRFESEGIRHDADVIQVTKRSVCTRAMLNT